MEYLYSRTNRAFEEDFAGDPDTPDGLQEKDLAGDCGGFCLFYEESLLKSWGFDARI